MRGQKTNDTPKRRASQAAAAKKKKVAEKPKTIDELTPFHIYKLVFRTCEEYEVGEGEEGLDICIMCELDLEMEDPYDFLPNSSGYSNPVKHFKIHKNYQEFLTQQYSLHYPGVQILEEMVNVSKAIKVKELVLGIAREVVKSIVAMLPLKFGLIRDGWSHQNNHFIGIYVNFLKQVDNKPVFLGLVEFEDKEAFTADEHIAAIEKVLKSYNRNWKNVLFMTTDNPNVNRSIADKMKLNMIA
eukprot:NODE_176_length_14102_cov_0.889595.p7 type:complete len:242 gc:universal NODE_176_length_14102_cov_0.889595:10835-11560(+)